MYSSFFRCLLHDDSLWQMTIITFTCHSTISTNLLDVYNKAKPVIFTMILSRLFVCSIHMPNKKKNHVFFCQQYPEQISLKFYTIKVNYPKCMLHIKVFSLLLWLSWTEKTLSFLTKKNKDNKMFLIAFSVLVLCIWPCFLYLLWPCFLYLLWPSLEPGQGSFSQMTL